MGSALNTEYRSRDVVLCKHCHSKFQQQLLMNEIFFGRAFTPLQASHLYISVLLFKIASFGGGITFKYCLRDYRCKYKHPKINKTVVEVLTPLLPVRDRSHANNTPHLQLRA